MLIPGFGLYPACTAGADNIYFDFDTKYSSINASLNAGQ